MTPYLKCSHATWRSHALTFLGFAALGGLSGWAGMIGAALYIMT